ncbi:MAG: hypothetical protein ACOYLX_02130 [Burkholderiaceae bacterium]
MSRAARGVIRGIGAAAGRLALGLAGAIVLTGVLVAATMAFGVTGLLAVMGALLIAIGVAVWRSEGGKGSSSGDGD